VITRYAKALISRFREELDGLKGALARAPEPELSWDFMGSRRTLVRVWWALKQEHSTPARMAVAVFVGVLIGTSPFYGFHVILCLLVAFLFRLNKLVVWLGSNVSLPMIAPFLAFFSIQCGHLMIHGRLSEVSLDVIQRDGATGLLWYWVLGFLPVGAVLGLVFALLVLWRLRPEEASNP